MDILNLEELDILAKKYGFSGAHNAITCADIYRKAYSENMHKYEEQEKVLNCLLMILPNELKNMLETKIKEIE